jgi:hypothetical protein
MLASSLTVASTLSKEIIMIDFADLYDGKILLHADDVVVAASADVNYLAAVIQREGGLDPDLMTLSMAFYFPEDYGFDGDPVALLNEAVDLAKPPTQESAFMAIDVNGYRWYWDTEAEMLEAIRSGAVVVSPVENPPSAVTAYMVIDSEGYRWYYDTKVEMLESIRLGNVTATEYYELSGTVKLIGVKQ